jgi:hypothetical protein
LILKDAGQNRKWGHVRVFDAKGNYLRWFRIESADLAAFDATGVPIGATADELKTCIFSVAGKDFEVGEARKEPDGTVKVVYICEDRNGSLYEEWVTLESVDYTGTYPAITAAPANPADAVKLATKLTLVDGTLTVVAVA